MSTIRERCIVSTAQVAHDNLSVLVAMLTCDYHAANARGDSASARKYRASLDALHLVQPTLADLISGPR